MQGPIDTHTAEKSKLKFCLSSSSRWWTDLGLFVFLFSAIVAAQAADSPQGFQPESSQISSGIPITVIQDLISSGKFDEAEAALNQHAGNPGEAAIVADLRERITKSRQAASLFNQAEGHAGQALALHRAEQNAARTVAASPPPPPPAPAASAGSTAPPNDSSAASLLLPEEARSKQSSIEDVALAQAADLFQKGFKAEQDGDYDQASKYYSDVLSLFPNSEDAKRRLLAIEGKRGSSTQGRPALARNTGDSTDIVFAIAPEFDKGVQSFNAGEYKAARLHFEHVLNIAPDHAPSKEYLEQCVALDQAQEQESAIADKSSHSAPYAVEEITQKPKSAFEIGRDLYAEGNTEQAKELLEQVPPQSNDYAGAQVYLKRIDGEATHAPSSQREPESLRALIAESDPVQSDPWAEPVGSSSASSDSLGLKAQSIDPLPAWNPEGKGQPLSEISDEGSLAQQSWPTGTGVALNTPEAPLPMSSVNRKAAPVSTGSTAQNVIEKAASAAPAAEALPAAPQAEYNIPTTSDEKVREYIEVGLRANEKGDILTAYEMWEKAIQLDPNNATAQDLLEKYADEQAEAKRRRSEQTRLTDMDQRVEQVLNEKTFRLEQDTSVNISSILSTMGAIADLQIITGEGVDGDIHALRTTEMTYRQVLDKVLSLNGYTWRRQPGTNIIEVTRDLVTKRFPLTEEQYQALKRLAMDASGGKETDDSSEALRGVVLGKVESKDVDATVPGRKFFLSKHLQELVVRDSRHNVEMVQQFLDLYKQGNLQVENKPLIVETFRLPKAGAQNLARIISLRLFGDAEFKSDFKDDQPYLVFDDKTNILIIRHTPDKLELVKRLMRDSKFVSQVSERELKARKYKVVPAEDLRSDTPDAQLRRRKQVQFTKQVFQSLLYGSQSIEEAAAEGRVMYPDLDAGTIDVVDTPENLRKIEEYLQGITETTNLTRTVIVQRRDVAELGYALQGLVLQVYINQSVGTEMSEDGQQQTTQTDRQQQQSQSTQSTQYGMLGMIPVIITADIQTKQMVIAGFRLSDLDKAEDLINRLDVPVDQVEIEVRLVELSYDSTDSFGVTMAISNILELDDNDEPGPGFTLADAAMDLVSRPNNPAGSSLTLATLGRTTIDATLNFLAQFSDIRILTAPKVTVVSGRQGHVFLGETIPFIESQTAVLPAGSNTPVIQSTPGSAEFGFTLDTIPTVTGDGHIELELQPELTVPGDRLPIPNPITGGLDPIGEPATDTREAVVRVRVKDGSTLVMGGLLRRQINHVEGRTPLFGFIPGLAPLFTEKSDIETTQNLLILVTARIIPEE